MGHKMAQCAQCLFAVSSKPERMQVAKMIIKFSLDKHQNLADHRIGFKLHGPRKGDAIRCRFAIFMIEIPLAAGRFIAIHQQACPPPHIAVKIFHPQRFATRSPSFKICGRGNEAIIVQHLDMQRHILQRVDQSPLSRLGYQNSRLSAFGRPTQQFPAN